ncbi:MerR family transcriptional regulator [Halobacteriovorax sp. BALOs_7]|uniref:redox-sensitive transcriptional activator SoxR n=1 Tax=unclassified Halobacteriovorax TaxID=2639665 RepID=UPI000EB6F980|nr:redox-sensitive transcriptional activator SoxR [Halobacteriovorax sp. BALOs_7]AYF44198.1 MerR family transcriptional regulator [Halobacteriovorax sp. BALOs_7]
MHKEKEYLSVGEMAKRSGVAVSAIHFYESKGLIRSHRNSGNQRRFHRNELRVLSYVKVAQKIGLSLEEIKDAFKSIVNKERPTLNDWKKLGENWDRILTERIELIQRVKSQLGLCIGCGCLSLQDCPLRNPNDKLGEKGPGPQILLSTD